MKKRMFGMKVLAALLTTVAMTGCVYDSDEDVTPSTSGGSTLTININSGAVGTTRSTDITNVDAAKTNEKQIQKMAVAVFKADAQDNNTPKLVYYNYLSDINQSAASGFSTTVDNVDADHQFAAGDQVIIVANVPSAVFEGVKAIGTTMADFKAVSVTIAQALKTGENDAVASTCLPMYGSVALTTSGASHLVANVSVGHMVSKITLESLEVNDIATGCSFKPEQVFLYNVADKLNFNLSTENNFSTYTSPAVTTWYTGEASQLGADNYAAYLGTKVYTDGDGLETLTNTNTTLSHSCVLYAMPNVYASRNSEPDTRLVIKGTWTDTNTPANSGTCYYNFRLLNVVSGVAQESGQNLYPNRNYRIKVILKRKGATSIDTGVDVEANTAVAFSSVSAWGNGEQTTTFGDAGGATYAAVGDLLFSDGTWGSLDKYPSKTPVGIVFSTKVSAADIAAGYTHGYAIALKTVGTGVADGTGDATMAWSTESDQLGTEGNGYPAIDLSSSDLLDAYVARARYMDGRSETDLITSTTNYSQAKYPAAYAAVTTYANTVVAPPSGASNWYLPSIGQWYELIKAFGGITGYPDTYRTENCDGYWTGKASATATAINNYATGKLGSHSSEWVNFYFVSSGTSGYYWSSTESAKGAGYAFGLDFHTGGSLYLNGNSPKSDTARRVRPVIAF